jgi:cysteine synthase
MRILVCGGRTWGYTQLSCYTEKDKGVFNWGIDYLKNLNPSCMIHGKAKGADELGELTAKVMGIEELSLPANWKKHGKSAGPIRNQQMLDEGKPDLVVAFHGGVGTADMVRRAKAAGVKVIEVP